MSEGARKNGSARGKSNGSSVFDDDNTSVIEQIAHDVLMDVMNKVKDSDDEEHH